MLYSKRRKNLGGGRKKRSTRKSYRKNRSNTLRIRGGRPRQVLSFTEVMQHRTTTPPLSWKYIFDTYTISLETFNILKKANVAKLEDFISKSPDDSLGVSSEFSYDDLRKYFTLNEFLTFVKNNKPPFSLRDLIYIGFSVKELKDLGVTLKQFKDCWLSVKHLKGPFLAKDFVDLLHQGEGFTIKELTKDKFEQDEWNIHISSNTGFTVEELKEAGLTFDDFVKERYSPKALFNLGYTYGQIKPLYMEFKENLDVRIKEKKARKQALKTHITNTEKSLESLYSIKETQRTPRENQAIKEYEQDITTFSNNLGILKTTLKSDKNDRKSLETFFDRCKPLLGINRERRDDCTIGTL